MSKRPKESLVRMGKEGEMIKRWTRILVGYMKLSCGKRSMLYEGGVPETCTIRETDRTRR